MPDYEYDVAVSFAGEDRRLVEDVVRQLQDAGVSVFYDRDAQTRLWGRDLIESLVSVYRRKAFRTLVFWSSSYASKAFPTAEKRAALARSIETPYEPYLLILRIDRTPLPDEFSTIVYLEVFPQTASRITEAVLEHLEHSEHPLTGADSSWALSAENARKVSIRVEPTDQDGSWVAPFTVHNGGEVALHTVVVVVVDPGQDPTAAAEQDGTAAEMIVGNMHAGETFEAEFDHLHFSREPEFAELTHLGLLLFTDSWGQSWATDGTHWWRRKQPARMC